MYLEASEKGFFFKNQTTVSADRPTLKGVAKSIPLGNKKVILAISNLEKSFSDVSEKMLFPDAKFQHLRIGNLHGKKLFIQLCSDLNKLIMHQTWSRT